MFTKFNSRQIFCSFFFLFEFIFISTSTFGETTLSGIIVGEGKEEVVVLEVKNDTPAAKAGVLKDDTIRKINGEVVNSGKDYLKIVNNLIFGKEVKLQIDRRSDMLNILVIPSYTSNATGRVIATDSLIIKENDKKPNQEVNKDQLFKASTILSDGKDLLDKGFKDEGVNNFKKATQLYKEVVTNESLLKKDLIQISNNLKEMRDKLEILDEDDIATDKKNHKQTEIEEGKDKQNMDKIVENLEIEVNNLSLNKDSTSEYSETNELLLNVEDIIATKNKTEDKEKTTNIETLLAENNIEEKEIKENETVEDLDKKKVDLKLIHSPETKSSPSINEKNINLEKEEKTKKDDKDAKKSTKVKLTEKSALTEKNINKVEITEVIDRKSFKEAISSSQQIDKSNLPIKSEKIVKTKTQDIFNKSETTTPHATKKDFSEAERGEYWIIESTTILRRKPFSADDTINMLNNLIGGIPAGTKVKVIDTKGSLDKWIRVDVFNKSNEIYTRGWFQSFMVGKARLKEN